MEATYGRTTKRAGTEPTGVLDRADVVWRGLVRRRETPRSVSSAVEILTARPQAWRPPVPDELGALETAALHGDEIGLRKDGKTLDLPSRRSRGTSSVPDVGPGLVLRWDRAGVRLPIRDRGRLSAAIVVERVRRPSVHGSRRHPATFGPRRAFGSAPGPGEGRGHTMQSDTRARATTRCRLSATRRRTRRRPRRSAGRAARAAAARADQRDLRSAGAGARPRRSRAGHKPHRPTPCRPAERLS